MYRGHAGRGVSSRRSTYVIATGSGAGLAALPRRRELEPAEADTPAGRCAPAPRDGRAGRARRGRGRGFGRSPRPACRPPRARGRGARAPRSPTWAGRRAKSSKMSASRSATTVTRAAPRSSPARPRPPARAALSRSSKARSRRLAVPPSLALQELRVERAEHRCRSTRPPRWSRAGSCRRRPRTASPSVSCTASTSRPAQATSRARPNTAPTSSASSPLRAVDRTPTDPPGPAPAPPRAASFADSFPRRHASRTPKPYRISATTLPRNAHWTLPRPPLPARRADLRAMVLRDAAAESAKAGALRTPAFAPVPPSGRSGDRLGLQAVVARRPRRLAGLRDRGDARPSSLASSSSPPRFSGWPWMTRVISLPVSVSYSSRPFASRSRSSRFSVRMRFAVS